MPDLQDTPAASASRGNILLQRLAPEDLQALEPYMQRVRVRPDDSIAAAGEFIREVCFLEGSLAGFLDVLADGRRVAVGLVGREGFVGWPLLLGETLWPYDVSARAAEASALKIEKAAFEASTQARPALRALLLQFSAVFTAQMGRTIVSNLIHPVDRRTARWLLMYHDRLEVPEIALTHEEISVMLGVRRASVTDALHALEGRGLIRSLRGRVIIQDRPGLEDLAGEAYGHAERCYRRLVLGETH